MKYVNWNRTRALAAVCAMVILLSATGLTAFADNAEANQADLQQVMRMGPQGRNKMQGGPRQDEQHMPFGKQDGDFAPPADGEQPPEKPDGDFAPPADGEQPPEKPDGDFAPDVIGDQFVSFSCRTPQLRKTSSAGCGDISDRDSALRKLPDRTDPRQGG